MCSPYINGWCTEWLNNCCEGEDDTIRDEVLYSGKKALASNISPNNLLSLLTTLEEEDREEYIKWRGKILPVGSVSYIVTEESKDSEMVTLVIEKVKRSRIVHLGYGEGVEFDDLLEEFLDLWESSNRNTFNVANAESGEMTEGLKLFLGVQQKKRAFIPDPTGLKQTEIAPIKNLKYHNWIEEVYSRLKEEPNTQEYQCSFEQMLEEPFPDGHPITKICEEALNKLLGVILNTNAAIYASKITNLYSRLGGTYKTHKIEGNKAKETVAFMPIYGTLRSKEQTIKITRMVQGICVRGPQHARSPTDKIHIATIEIVDNTPENSTMVAFMNKAVVHVCGDTLVVMRQNSIMKEDPFYQGFVMNALFCVANNLGYMTLACPNLRPDVNMPLFIEET